MNKKILMIFAAAILVLPAVAQTASPSEIDRLLQSVESNNLTLQSENRSVVGRSAEARMGNSLEPLSVNYSAVWDSPKAAGKSGEFEVSQGFDLPMLYVTRSRMAKKLAEQYQTEYLALRQQILLEAKEVYLELCMLNSVSEFMQMKLKSSQHVAKLYAARYETGDATIVDKNRSEFEYMLLKESISQNDLRMIELKQRLLSLNGGQSFELTYKYAPAEAIMPLDNLLADWEEYAPDITVLRIQEEVARQDVRLSRQQALPKIEIGYKNEYGIGENFSGIVAGLSIPIFSNRHNVKRAKAMEQAARINRESVLLERRNILTEIYMKVQYMENMLGSFGEMPDNGEYIAMLGRLLESGQINIVDYYSDLDTFYSALEMRLKVDFEYRIGLARMNVIYM